MQLECDFSAFKIQTLILSQPVVIHMDENTEREVQLTTIINYALHKLNIHTMIAICGSSLWFYVIFAFLYKFWQSYKLTEHCQDSLLVRAPDSWSKDRKF